MKLYLYLGKRNKQGIKIISVFNNINHPVTRIKNIKELSLNAEMEQFVSGLTYEYRMDWELFIESAENYEKLLQQLMKRGYSNLSSYSTPLYRPKISITEKKEFKPTVKSHEKKHTMIRKKLV